MTIDLLPELPCYLNGEFSTLRDAKVSVMDRGFIFGDGVYEVVPVYAGRPFRFDEHMARLDRSLAELRIANPMSHARVARAGRPADRRIRAVTGQDGRRKPTSWSTSRSRAAWRMRDHVDAAGPHSPPCSR